MTEAGRYALYTAGVLNLGLLVFHAFFWRLFRWRGELAKLSSLNRSVVQIMNLCLMALFAVLAYISFAHARELLASPLGHALLAGFALLWFLRAAEHVWFFGLRKSVAIFFTSLFVVLSALYAVPLAIVARLPAPNQTTRQG